MPKIPDRQLAPAKSKEPRSKPASQEDSENPGSRRATPASFRSMLQESERPDPRIMRPETSDVLIEAYRQ